MRTRRSIDESGWLVAPWPVGGVGHVMGTTATLMERSRPYNLLVELARGKINQMRCQAADWRMGGLQISPELQQTIHAATLTFGRAVTSVSGGSSTVQETKQAQDALEQGYRAAQQLVDAYAEQVFSIRQQRDPKLETTLGCRLTPHAGNVPAVLQGSAVPFVQAFNSVSLPFFWCDVELEE